MSKKEVNFPKVLKQLLQKIYEIAKSTDPKGVISYELDDKPQLN